MKTVFLLRHAKSSWKFSEMRDFDRPLTASGKRNAAAVGRFLRKNKLKPDLIVSSPAERARETIELALEAAKLPVELRFDERIYEADTARLFEVISQVDEKTRSCLLVGHNPGFEELLGQLTGVAQEMPTSAFAEIALDIDTWRQVGPLCGTLNRFVTPRELVQ